MEWCAQQQQRAGKTNHEKLSQLVLPAVHVYLPAVHVLHVFEFGSF